MKSVLNCNTDGDVQLQAGLEYCFVRVSNDKVTVHSRKGTFAISRLLIGQIKTILRSHWLKW